MNLTLLIVVGALVASYLVAVVLFSRTMLARITVSLLSLGFAACCSFGFLASYELSDSTRSVWQLAYGTLGLGSLLIGCLAMLIKLPRKNMRSLAS